MNPWTEERLESIAYNEEQQRAINFGMEQAKLKNGMSDRYWSYAWSAYFMFENDQAFAVIRDLVRDVAISLRFEEVVKVPLDRKKVTEYLPVVIKGKMLAQFTDDGQGLLVLSRTKSTLEDGSFATTLWEADFLDLPLFNINTLTSAKEAS